MNKKLKEIIIKSYYEDDKDKLNFFIPLVQNKIQTLKEAQSISGTLSKTSKMPCRSYGITASACDIGNAMKKMNNDRAPARQSGGIEEVTTWIPVVRKITT